MILSRISSSYATWAVSVVLVGGCTGGTRVFPPEAPEGKSAGTVHELRPGEDPSAVLATLRPGDEVVFRPGVYLNPVMSITRSGTLEAPIVIRGPGAGERRPILRYDTTTSPIRVMADHIVIRDLELDIIKSGNVIRISEPGGGTRRGVTIEGNVFRGSTNVTIDTNGAGGLFEDIRVVGNTFLGLRYTGLYFGAHDGSNHHRGLVVERNYVDVSRVDRRDIIGYGMEFKLNVKGARIRENVVVGAQGPGIMVYGAQSLDPADANVVERNVLAGARNSPGILVGGGPSEVRDNVSVGNPGGGIRAYDYGGRGLFHQVVIADNTAGMNGSSDFSFALPGTYSPQRVTVTGNHAVSSPNRPAYLNLPAESSSGWTVSGNESFEGDDELGRLIQELQSARPEEEALRVNAIMHRVGPHLARLESSPLRPAELRQFLLTLVGALR